MTLKGMKFPIGVSPSGGSEKVQSSGVVGQNVIIALIPASSRHPWNQTLAPPEDFIFEIKDMVAGNLYTSHVRDFFEVQEELGYARLYPGEQGIHIRPIENSPSGELEVMIHYEDLESGKAKSMSFPLSTGG